MPARGMLVKVCDCWFLALTSFALASFVTRPLPGSGSPCWVAYLTRLLVSNSPSTSLIPLSLCRHTTHERGGGGGAWGEELGGS